MNKFEDLMNAMKLGEFMHKKEEKKCTFLCCLGVIAGIVALAAIGYAIYKHFRPDYLEDFDDDEDYEEEEFDDDYDELEDDVDEE